jgi:hypothetical protein
MADWILVPCLVQLRTEFNRIAPNRDRTTDGSIGDTAHQGRASDHNADEQGAVPIHDADRTNEVHAIDVDVDLKVDGLTMERVVQFLLARCRSGAEKRLRYIIYARRIWEASNDWKQRAYSGANAHTAHAHFSASYDSKLEASTASWHMEDLVALTDAEIEKIAATVWARKIASPALGIEAKPAGDWLKDAEQVSRELAALGRSLAAAVAALAAKDAVDEQALAAALAPGLAAAVVAALPADRDDITAAELQEAILGVLRRLPD